MPRFRAIPAPLSSNETLRSSIRGNAIMPADVDVPACGNCGNEVLLFLQFDIDDSWSLPFETGSHLVVFMCPNCNEIPSFDTYEQGNLPDKFWDTTERHFFTALTKPVAEEVVLTQQPLLTPKALRFEPFAEAGHAPDQIVVGGEPYWLQEAGAVRLQLRR